MRMAVYNFVIFLLLMMRKLIILVRKRVMEIRHGASLLEETMIGEIVKFVLVSKFSKLNFYILDVINFCINLELLHLN